MVYAAARLEVTWLCRSFLGFGGAALSASILLPMEQTPSRRVHLPPPCRLAAAALAMVMAAGCAEEDLPTAAAPQAATVAAPAAPQQPRSSSSGGGSALGGAKRAAKGTADKIEDQQQRLLHEMEKMERGEQPTPP
jgi:hypothetical protein